MFNKISVFLVLIVSMAVNISAEELSLEICKKYALENNKKIRESNYEIKASEEVKKSAYTKYYPNISANATVMKAMDPLLEAEVPEMNLPVYDGNPANLRTATEFAYFPGMKLELLDYTNLAAVNIIQPIYAGGRIRNANKLAGLAIDIKKKKSLLTIDEVLLRTENYFWTIRSLEEKMNTLLSYEKLLKTLESDVQTALHAGLVQKSDLLKVQLEISKINANKIKLTNGTTLLKMSLAQHIGVEYSEEFDISTPVFDTPAPETIKTDHPGALKSRNEIQLLNMAVEAGNLQKDIQAGEYYPQLSIGAQALYLDIMDTESSNLIGMVNLSVPISDWWGGSHEIEEKEIEIEIAKNNLEEKSELIALQIEKSYRDLFDSFQQIKVAEASVLQAEEHLKVIQDNYDAGIVTTSDLLEARAIHQSTLNDLTDAKANYKIKQANYLVATARY